MFKKMQFIGNRHWLNKDQDNKPSPIIKYMPKWFREADRFAKIPGTDEFWVGPPPRSPQTWTTGPA